MTIVTPIRFTTDIAASTAFYRALGLAERTGETSRSWASLMGEGGDLGLHIASASTTAADADAVSLQFTVADGALERARIQLVTAGYEPGAIMDETFGRFFVVADPDGYRIQVNELPEEFSRSYVTEDSRRVLAERDGRPPAAE